MHNGRSTIAILRTSIALVAAAIALPACAGDSASEEGAPVAELGASAASVPANVLDLKNWKVTLPTGSEGSPKEVKQPALATFSVDPYFKVNAGGNGVQFRAPTNGVTTSGSSYPRSELREMKNDGTANASWSTSSGTHTMTIDQAITAVPRTKKHVVAGQIHDGDDDVIVIRLEMPKLFIDINGSDGPTLDANYTLGKRFTVKFVASGGKIKIYYNGGTSPAHTLSKSTSGCYFKAGAYTQSNCEKEGSACGSGNYGEVNIYGLKVEHSSGSGAEEEEAAVDADGVQMLFPSAAAGSSFRLGTSDPNETDKFTIEKGTDAQQRTDGGIRYWNIPSYPLDYSSGGSGWTSRLHVHASGGTQQYTWKTQKGHLSNAKDLKNQEFTVYARIHEVLDASRAAVALKVRGGKHSSSDGDMGACILLELTPSSRGFTSRFGKELTHPKYDYVKLAPKFTAQLEDNAWIGLKMVSYASPSQPKKVTNRLYLDTDPFDRASGKPKNGWRLYSEYMDEEGKSSGSYTKLVDWGGWQTTFRTDGIKSLDFAIVSVREIVPPA